MKKIVNVKVKVASVNREQFVDIMFEAIAQPMPQTTGISVVKGADAPNGGSTFYMLDTDIRSQLADFYTLVFEGGEKFTPNALKAAIDADNGIIFMHRIYDNPVLAEWTKDARLSFILGVLST